MQEGAQNMEQDNKIPLFENKIIRTAWDDEQEEWYFSIVDVVEVLTGTENPRLERFKMEAKKRRG